MTEELANLQGTWTFVSLEVDGTEVPQGAFAGSTLVVREDTFVTTAPDATYEGRFVLDVRKRPHKIDMNFTGGPETGKSSLGIYEIEGDTWRICLALVGRARPRKFVSAPGTGHTVEVLQRRAVAGS